MGIAFDAFGLSIPLIMGWLYQLTIRLRGPHPLSKPQDKLSSEELDNVSYDGIDMLEAIPNKPTHEGYVVVGGSGFLGSYVVQLLLLRGETQIRILDLYPPSASLLSHRAVTFVKTDITSLSSVRDALIQPFPSSGVLPTVIYHTAAVVRFWERLAYTWDSTYRVNVRGTQNVVTAAQELPSVILVYTSSIDVAATEPKFWRLGRDLAQPPHNKVTYSDEDKPLDPAHRVASCYARSKVLAEDVIRAADSGALKTGIIRPGCAISGPNDHIIANAFATKEVLVWDELWSCTNVCVWDAAAAHLCLEGALRSDREAVRGQAFLVTGKGKGWRFKEVREAIKHYSDGKVQLRYVHPLFIYILGHLIEAVLFLRYHVLLFLFTPSGAKPSLVPTWMRQAMFLQPQTFKYMSDIYIDDSRARKLLGYEPQWDTAQCIRWSADEILKGKGGPQQDKERPDDGRLLVAAGNIRS